MAERRRRCAGRWAAAALALVAALALWGAPPAARPSADGPPGLLIAHWIDVGQGDAAFWAFVPHPLPPRLDWTPGLVGRLSQADRALGELAGLLNISPDNVIIEPNPNRTVDFRVVLGSDYNSCVGRQWVAPVATGDTGES